MLFYKDPVWFPRDGRLGKVKCLSTRGYAISDAKCKFYFGFAEIVVRG